MAHASAKDQTRSLWHPHPEMKISYAVHWRQTQTAASPRLTHTPERTDRLRNPLCQSQSHNCSTIRHWATLTTETQAHRLKTALYTSIAPQILFTWRKVTQYESKELFLPSRHVSRQMGWHKPPDHDLWELQWQHDGRQQCEIFNNEQDAQTYQNVLRIPPKDVHEIFITEHPNAYKRKYT